MNNDNFEISIMKDIVLRKPNQIWKLTLFQGSTGQSGLEVWNWSKTCLNGWCIILCMVAMVFDKGALKKDEIWFIFLSWMQKEDILIYTF